MRHRGATINHPFLFDGSSDGAEEKIWNFLYYWNLSFAYPSCPCDEDDLQCLSSSLSSSSSSSSEHSHTEGSGGNE